MNLIAPRHVQAQELMSHSNAYTRAHTPKSPGREREVARTSGRSPVICCSESGFSVILNFFTGESNESFQEPLEPRSLDGEFVKKTERSSSPNMRSKLSAGTGPVNLFLMVLGGGNLQVGDDTSLFESTYTLERGGREIIKSLSIWRVHAECAFSASR